MRKVIKFFLLVFGMIILIGFVLKGNIAHEKFDSEKWKTSDLNNENNLSLHWDMMNGLRNDYKLEGMTKSEIIELLGKPDSKTSSDFGYYLGYSKHGINTGRLTIIFDENGIVTDFNVWDG